MLAAHKAAQEEAKRLAGTAEGQAMALQVLTSIWLSVALWPEAGQSAGRQREGVSNSGGFPMWTHLSRFVLFCLEVATSHPSKGHPQNSLAFT